MFSILYSLPPFVSVMETKTFRNSFCHPQQVQSETTYKAVPEADELNCRSWAVSSTRQFEPRAAQSAHVSLH